MVDQEWEVIILIFILLCWTVSTGLRLKSRMLRGANGPRWWDVHVHVHVHVNLTLKNHAHHTPYVVLGT